MAGVPSFNRINRFNPPTGSRWRAVGSLPAGRLGRLAAVAPERPGRRELAELVPDHVLGHVELDEVLAVVDREVLADELGHDRAGTRPGLDRLAVAGLVGPVHPLEQALDDVRAFLQRTSHGPLIL